MSESRIEIKGDRIFFQGRNTFIFDLAERNLQLISDSLKSINFLLESIFSDTIFRHRKFLDFSKSDGFFSYKAALLGCEQAYTLDKNPDCVENISAVNALWPDIPVKSEYENIPGRNEKGDIVMAMSLIDWIGAESTFANSLGKTLDWFAGLAEDAMIVEWISPEDAQFKQLTESQVVEDYSEAVFLGSLRKHFDSIRCLGTMSPTRSLYWATKKNRLADLSWKAPLCFEKTTVLSSQILHIEDGVALWSRVYKVDDKIFKQTSRILAEREFEASLLVKDPTILDINIVEKHPDWWLISYPFFEGIELTDCIDDLKSEERSYVFAKLLEIIVRLHTIGVKHRDIHPGNIIINREKKSLKLIDYGWASVGVLADMTPQYLGNSHGFKGRPKGDPSDLYALGKFAKSLASPETPLLSIMGRLLSGEGWNFRIDSTKELEEMWQHLHLIPSHLLLWWELAFREVEISCQKKIQDTDRKQLDMLAELQLMRSEKIRADEASALIQVQKQEYEQLQNEWERIRIGLELSHSEYKKIESDRERIRSNLDSLTVEFHRVSLGYLETQLLNERQAAEVRRLNILADERFDPTLVGMSFYIKQFLLASKRKLQRMLGLTNLRTE